MLPLAILSSSTFAENWSKFAFWNSDSSLNNGLNQGTWTWSKYEMQVLNIWKCTIDRLQHHFGGMLELKSGLRFFVSAPEVLLFGTWKRALLAKVPGSSAKKWCGWGLYFYLFCFVSLNSYIIKHKHRKGWDGKPTEKDAHKNGIPFKQTDTLWQVSYFLLNI